MVKNKEKKDSGVVKKEKSSDFIERKHGGMDRQKIHKVIDTIPPPPPKKKNKGKS